MDNRDTPAYSGIENTLTYEHNSGNFVPDILFDYFANEIFLKLSDEIKDFLLKTSYLEHFTSELCSHVTGLKIQEKFLSIFTERIFS